MTNTAKSLIRRTELLAPKLDYWLVDGSSSMQSKWWETMACMDEYLKVLKAANTNSHGIAVTFDSQELQCIQRDSRISDWKPFSEEPLGAFFGSTPLYDAINLMARHLRDLDPSPASCIVIVTDGEENCSRHTDVHQAKSMLDWCRAKGWQVIFLGADFDNSSQAAQLGATADNSIGVRSMKLLEAGRALGEKRARHANGGEDIHFSTEEKQKFGGYLGHG